MALYVDENLCLIVASLLKKVVCHNYYVEWNTQRNSVLYCILTCMRCKLAHLLNQLNYNTSFVLLKDESKERLTFIVNKIGFKKSGQT